MADISSLSPARRAYEERQAKKAGKTLDAWLKAKEKKAIEAAKPATAPSPPKPPGMVRRLLDRLHKPL